MDQTIEEVIRDSFIDLIDNGFKITSLNNGVDVIENGRKIGVKSLISYIKKNVDIDQVEVICKRSFQIQKKDNRIGTDIYGFKETSDLIYNGIHNLCLGYLDLDPAKVNIIQYSHGNFQFDVDHLSLKIFNLRKIMSVVKSFNKKHNDAKNWPYDCIASNISISIKNDGELHMNICGQLAKSENEIEKLFKNKIIDEDYDIVPTYKPSLFKVIPKFKYIETEIYT